MRINRFSILTVDGYASGLSCFLTAFREPLPEPTANHYPCPRGLKGRVQAEERRRRATLPRPPYRYPRKA